MPAWLVSPVSFAKEIPKARNTPRLTSISSRNVSPKIAAKKANPIARYLLCSMAVMYLRCQSCRSRRAAQLYRKLRRTANLHKFFAIALQLRMLGQRRADFAKNARRVFVGRIGQPVMHPLSFTPGGDNSRPPQICQMPRNLWLTGF